MSDDENGGGGWDDEAPADNSWDDGAQENGDDGWGAADTTNADEWGDKAENAGDGDAAEEAPLEVQLENTFYEADDNRLERNISLALEQFQKVVDLGMPSLDSLSDESIAFVFKSIRNIVSLHLQSQALDKMAKAYDTLLHLVPKVTRNDALDAVSTVLHEVSDCKDKNFVAKTYKSTATYIKSLPDQERLWFRVNMKYCEYCFAREDYKEASAELDALLQSCRLPDGRDDLSKGSELLEIYALESRISAATKDSVKLQALYERTKNLNAAVKDPRSLSVIRECWGEMFGDQGDWNRAYQEFYSAFTAYQEIGNAIKAKQCLKYVVIANMLSGGTSNPFDSREAKAFQSDKEIEAIGLLRNAYEKCDVNRFNSLLSQVGADPFVRKHLGSMVRDFQSRAMQQILKSYRRVRLDYLAEMLQIETAQVEGLLVPLILDGLVVGKIDQVKGLLDLTQSVGGGQKYLAIERWASTLNILRSQLPTPAATKF